MPSIKITSTQPARITTGVHKGEIINAVEGVSKNNNETLKLNVKVGPLTFNTWVTFTEANQDNVVQFAKAVGIKVTDDQVLAIEAHDVIGRSGLVNLKPGKRISEKTNEPFLEIANWVLPEDAVAVSSAAKKSIDLESDEIPF